MDGVAVDFLRHDFVRQHLVLCMGEGLGQNKQQITNLSNIADKSLLKKRQKVQDGREENLREKNRRRPAAACRRKEAEGRRAGA